jgi:NADPH:quinone reductase-like Zn-dependent oxidoreductase
MKAIVYAEFGPPEVLQLTEVAKPVPLPKQVLIRNYATTVAAEDPPMRAAPGLNGFTKPRKPILGFYFAGEVESVGQEVTRFRRGDQVYGSAGLSYGSYAQYLCVPEDGALALKPSNMSYEEAAAVPNGGLTALPFLRDKGRIKSGYSVLVNGASGAVGTSAVQLARAFGADVTGVCSAANLELVKSLGAGQVVDYTQQDFTQAGGTYDIIFDAVGKRSFSECRVSLKRKGVYLTTVPTPGVLFQMLRTRLAGGRKARIAFTALRPARARAKDLAVLKGFVEAGKLRAVIDRRYPLAEMAEAHRYVETGRKRGNVVIIVEHDS